MARRITSAAASILWGLVESKLLTGGYQRHVSFFKAQKQIFYASASPHFN